jgi:beta-galactosidase/beta-glucuronidase
MKRMVADAEKATFTAWELSTNVGKLFHTTIRSHSDEMSLLPCFDVEYKAKTEMGIVTISVTTQRRNVTVTVDGKAEALDFLHGQVVMAGMRG